ncbi:TlpA family protein disulfide reductase [Pedobacter ginsengisoli]|uniref:TlpA family protein disulfide reductase n=1 Tax=Pedobacter ginsengisoli TaxID=363852 RepID=UPI002550BB35|nr:TlpA disulfide reductase family protein [Pedobacter ginsengisoli]
MKTLTLIMTFLLSALMGTNAQNSPVKSEADLYWDTMPKKTFIAGSISLAAGPEEIQIPDSIQVDLQINGDKQGLLAKRRESLICKNIYDEIFRRMLRDWGIEFWRRFPDDPRRFQWLVNTCLMEPAYFVNLRNGALATIEERYLIALDTIAKKQWKELSQKYFQEVSLSTELQEPAKKNTLRFQFNQIRNQRWRDSENEKFNIDEFFERIIAFVTRYGDSGTSQSFKEILRFKADLGLNSKDIKHLIDLLKATSFESFQKEADYLEKIVRLEEEPLSLNAKSIKGDEVDLNQFRDNLVLIDFWNIYCAACILKMPEIKTVYEKYKDQGFRVISACLYDNGKFQKNELGKIKAIYGKIGADWPLVLLGGDKGQQGRQIFDTYDFFGVPQLLLLDEKGKLLHYNGDLENKGGLEKLVKEHLAKRNNIQKSK